MTCATKYKVKVRQDTTGGIVADKAKNLPASQYTTNPLTNGHTYFWRAWACNAFGCAGSGWQSFIVNAP